MFTNAGMNQFKDIFLGNSNTDKNNDNMIIPYIVLAPNLDPKVFTATSKKITLAPKKKTPTGIPVE